MGFKLKKAFKGLKKVFKNPTHSKLYKNLPFGRYKNKLRKRLGLTGHRLKKSVRELSGISPSGTSVNSAGAVIPSIVGRSVTEMY